MPRRRVTLVMSATGSPVMIALRPGSSTGSSCDPRTPSLASWRMASALAAPERTRTADVSGGGSRRLDLDVVRGCAILLALGWHFSKHPSGNRFLDLLQWPGRTFGWAGVDLFFVLSGFFVGQLVLREHQRTGRFDGRRFTVRRALKLWPVLYVFLAVQVLAGPIPSTPISGRRRCTCRTTPARRSATSGRWRWRSTSTSCWRCCSRWSPVGASLPGFSRGGWPPSSSPPWRGGSPAPPPARGPGGR